jgi:hypothetical protein
LSSSLVELLLKQKEIIEMIDRLDLTPVLDVVLWVTTDDSKPTPAIGFESKAIDFLSQIGATIDIDTYRN